MKRIITIVAALGVATIASAAPGLDIDKIAGVYKSQFKNGNISGDKYQSEDVLEIVKVSPTVAYIRTHLEFFNGHVCNIWGVGDKEGDALVYRAKKENVEGKFCVLSVKVKAGKVVIDDKDGACAVGTCGNRGMYNGTTFELKKRRAELKAKGGFPYPAHQTPWQELYRQTVGQQATGACMELATRYHDIAGKVGVARDNH